MKVLLMEPAHSARGRGNATTVERYARAAVAAGHSVLRATPTTQFRERCDLIHAHHAVRCGPAALSLAQQWACPLVLSLGGTDLHGQQGQGVDPAGIAPLKAATLILAPFAADAALLAAVGIDAKKLRVVRRAAACGPQRGGADSPVASTGTLRVLSLGALRPLKNQMLALHLAQLLRAAGLSVELCIAGAPLDAVYAATVQQALQADDLFLGAVPESAIAALLAETDLLLNTSTAEGASNAILEAMAAGVAVAATAVHGNTELLRHAPSQCARLLPQAGAASALLDFARQLTNETPAQRVARQSAAIDHVALHHAPADEARELLAAWHAAALSA